MNTSVGRLMAFGETGALVRNEVLNRELLFDIFWADGTWAKVGPSVRRVRERSGDARFYENFELLRQTPTSGRA